MAMLLEPIKAGKLELKNRLVMPPMATSAANEDGTVSKAILEYYDEKSNGGCFGLIIIEHSFIAQQGKASEKQLSLADDSVIPGLKELADIIHKNGSKAVIQLNYSGSMGDPAITGLRTLGPSPVINPRSSVGAMPREMNHNDIRRIKKDFADAAIRVKDAGFDGVEIHSAHGYMLNQFYSPVTNIRTDEYGGKLKNRIRFHMEVIMAVQEAVGEDYPILLRLGASDHREDGTNVNHSIEAALEFKKAGIDIIDISGGLSGFILPDNTEQGYFKDLSSKIKREVNIPVILTGGITKPIAAEDLLEEGAADLIGVGRAVLKDSSWAKNAIETLK
jgi:2,4-dienoyl-CoA reductase-like NADH-dependent reductase (Old Yellow Enzyme family)